MPQNPPPKPEDLEPIERASRDELSALQTGRMAWSLRHAYDNVAPFREKCAAHGVTPDDFKSLSDIKKFPFTAKDDLRAHFPYGMFAVPMDDIVRIHASSGTTGKPTVVGYTRADIDMWAGLLARSIRAGGGRRSDVALVSYGYGLFTGGLGAHYGAERLGCAVIPMSGGQTEKQVQMIKDFDPDLLMATPSYALVIADEMERQNVDPKKTAMRMALCGAEPWTEKMRGELEARLDIDALDHYGLSEVIGPGVASECVETKDGLHIWEDHFYPEIVDPVTGAVLPDGDIGELVFTSLTKQAMPVIRYRTRDLSRLKPGTARPMRRMEKVTGRSDDMLIIRGVNMFPSQVEEMILKDGRLAPHYQLEVKRQGRLDTLDVLVEPRPGLLDESSGAAAATELARAIKTFIGVTCDVRLIDAGGIERSLGKAKRVIDLRPKD